MNAQHLINESNPITVLVVELLLCVELVVLLAVRLERQKKLQNHEV